MTLISAVIIAHNEEGNIERSIRSVLWCDEVIVIDSFSEDKTVQISTSLGAKVIQNKFDGFGEQKRFGVEQAKNDWILSLDADEEITESLKMEILKEFNSTPKFDAYYLKRTMVFLGRQFKHGKESKEKIVRLFDRNKGSFNTPKVHESVIVDGTTGIFKNTFLHYSYTSVQQYFEKFNNYTTRGAQELKERGKKSSLVKIVLRFPIGFFQNYLLKGNFLNGFEGFIWALFSTFYPIVKYVKLYNLYKNKKN